MIADHKRLAATAAFLAAFGLSAPVNADSAIVTYKHGKQNAYLLFTNWGMIADAATEGNDKVSYIFFESETAKGMFAYEADGISDQPVLNNVIRFPYSADEKCMMVFRNIDEGYDMSLEGDCEKETYRFIGEYAEVK